MDVTNHHLRVITAIADAGSIGRAALRLGTSHAALSAQLRRIERAMGGDLFVRSNAGCVPTPFGDAVLADARQQAHAEPGETMRVQIGGYTGIMLGELGRRIAGEPWASGVHLRDNPDSRVNVRMVADGDVDLALVYDWPPVAIPRPAKVRERIVFPDEPVFVMMSERHPLAQSSAVSFQALADFPWVDEPVGTTTWPVYLQHVCHHAGVSLHMGQSAVNLSEARHLVMTTLAVAPVLATTEAPPGLTIRALEGHPLRQRLRLIYRPDGPIATHITTVIRHLGQAYADHQECSDAFRTWWHTEGCHTMPVQ